MKNILLTFLLFPALVYGHFSPMEFISRESLARLWKEKALKMGHIDSLVKSSNIHKTFEKLIVDLNGDGLDDR